MRWRIKDWWRQLVDSGQPGWRGERTAERYLRNQCGFRLIRRNWRNPADRREEIDLVGLEGDVLVFVEVKGRSADDPLAGYHAVDWKKRRTLRRACTAFLLHWGHPRPSYRFDIVTVELGRESRDGAVRHYRNVGLFEGR